MIIGYTSVKIEFKEMELQVMDWINLAEDKNKLEGCC
jgi:hypothetical protein